MKTIFTPIIIAFLVSLSFNSFSQTCGTGGSFVAGATNMFTTSTEGFTGDFHWSATGSGELESSDANAGQIKKLRSIEYTLPVSTTTLYWSFKLAGTMNVQSYSAVAYYYTGATLNSVPLCSGGSLITSGSNFVFNAPVPSQISGIAFRIEITFTSTTNPSTKVLNVDDFATNATVASALIPLPVQLISFNGSLLNNKAQLKWFVAENELGDRFEIEKSSDGRNFSSIGYVFPTSKNGTQDYMFNEGIELTGAGYYRLKIVNKSGAVVLSNIVVLKNDRVSTANSLVVLQSKGAAITFNYTPAKAGKYYVNVYNASGAKMFATSINMQQGMNAASLKANGLASGGVYVLEVTNGLDRSVIKFLK